MAVVWYAKSYSDHAFEKEVALKQILPHIAEDQELFDMFIEEARVAARLEHPNICRIYEFGRTLSSLYITMEFIHGRDLRAVFRSMRKTGLKASTDWICRVGAAISDGLHHAHTLTDAVGDPLHIVHRDVSPQNVMISFNGGVKVIDFGIAKMAGRALETQVGVLKGKMGYMAPEQLDHTLHVDGRADQFCLGVLFWELAAGARLFTGANPAATLDAIRGGEIPPLADRRPDLPEGLVAIIERALQVDREERFPDMAAMGDAFREFLPADAAESNALVLADFMADLFPEGASPELSPNEVEVLFRSAEERGEDVTDPRVVDDATEVFIPDTSRIDVYRRQIEELLERSPGGTAPGVRQGSAGVTADASGSRSSVLPMLSGEFWGVDALFLLLGLVLGALILGQVAIAW
jgi:serine/threonine protein kinase